MKVQLTFPFLFTTFIKKHDKSCLKKVFKVNAGSRV